MAKTNIKNSNYFKGTLNYNNLRIEHQLYLKKMNDVLVETALTIQGMENVLEDVTARLENGETTYIIRLPNKLAKLIPIRRNLVSLQAKLSEDSVRSTYVRSLVFMITLAEDYLAASIRRVLRAYPQKLMISTKGKKLSATEQYQIDVRELLAAGSLDALIEQLATQRVREAVYASPDQYLGYFKSVCGVEFKETTWRKYVEVKATRDLFVHADGRVNAIYLQKAAQHARFGLGEIAIVDAAYFDVATSCLKALLSEIYTGLREKFADSFELKLVFDTDTPSKGPQES